MTRERLAAAGVGAVAGVLAMLVTTIALLGLRMLVGIPLPLELISDRFIPMLPVDTFLRFVGLVGGFVAGKRIGFISFFLGQVGLGAFLGALYGLVVARAPARRLPLLAAAALGAWAVTILVLWPTLDSSYRGLPPGWAHVVTALGLLLALGLFAASLAAFHSYATRPAAPRAALGREPHLSRRAVVLGGAGAALGIAAGGLATTLYRRSAIPYDGLETRAAEVDPITPNDRFYVVTKNFVDPRVDRSLWRLEVKGLVERPRMYGFDELVELESVEQETTLECISNGIGAGLISNARWTGVPLARLLEAAGVRDGAAHVFARGVDGYGHGFALEKALEPTTLVVYRMNGEPLPDRHGYPARLIVPGSYGEVSVKWIDRVAVLAEPEEGFYELQGWRAERVHTMSRIDRPLGRRSRRVGRPTLVNGVAFAGGRGIKRVELSTDGGRSWKETRLDYRGSRLSWALWSLDWTPERAGRHELVVRATDGDGELQTAERGGIAPDGATGFHRVTVSVVAPGA